MPPTMSKEFAEYQDHPDGDEQCSKCTMFRAPDRCTLVKGMILARGWCEHFEAK